MFMGLYWAVHGYNTIYTNMFLILMPLILLIVLPES
jgi:hypothetical protein